VEALCDRVTIIRAGQTVESGTLAELRHLTGTAIVAEVATVPVGLFGMKGVHDFDILANSLRFSVDPDTFSLALRELTNAGVISLISQLPTLEELFKRNYRTEQPLGADSNHRHDSYCEGRIDGC
jgi:ABC-2 type transport system ATP-binding protein